MPSGGACRQPALILDRVTLRYGSVDVVSRVSTQILRGEMVAVLGPNGAGKSTLLRLASGVMRPNAGRILSFGRDLESLSRRELARSVAVVPQDFSVQFGYTARQVVEMGRMPHHRLWSGPAPADREAVKRALEASHVTELADRIFNELSGGERQRVLVALALAQDAELLLLDEPTSHLDVKHQIEVLELLRRLNRTSGLTVVATMHDLNLAAHYFPRLLLLRTALVADGPPSRVLDATLLSQVYETPVRVGILRGEDRMSVLPASTRGTEEAPCKNEAEPRVHLIAGGGSGELVMRALADREVSFTAGPFNVGDTDYELAARLAFRCIGEPPFSPISTAGLRLARAEMRRSKVVVLCPAPLGAGNIVLLDAVLDTHRSGRRVILFEPTATPETLDTDAIAARDYSTKGVKVYRQLISAGAQIARTPVEALQEIRSILGGVPR